MSGDGVLELRWPDETWIKDPSALVRGLIQVMPSICLERFTIRDPRVLVRDPLWGRHQFREGLSGDWRWASTVILAQADPYNRNCQLEFGSGTLSVGEDSMYLTGDASMWGLRDSSAVHISHCSEDPWRPLPEEVASDRSLPDAREGLWEALARSISEGGAPLVRLDWGRGEGGSDWFRMEKGGDLSWFRRETRPGDLISLIEADGELIRSPRDRRLRYDAAAPEDVWVWLLGQPSEMPLRGDEQPEEFWEIPPYVTARDARQDKREGMREWLWVSQSSQDVHTWRINE